MNAISLRQFEPSGSLRAAVATSHTRALGMSDLGAVEVDLLRQLRDERVFNVEMFQTAAGGVLVRPVHSVVGHWRGVSGKTRREWVMTDGSLSTALDTLLDRRLDYIERKESGLLRFLGHSLKSRARMAFAALTGTTVSKGWERRRLPDGTSETVLLSAPREQVALTTSHGTQFVRRGAPVLALGNGQGAV